MIVKESLIEDTKASMLAQILLNEGIKANIVAYTSSNKPIYDVPWHSSYESFNETEHGEAANYHFGKYMAKWDELENKYGDSWQAKRKYENNRELNKHDANWKISEDKKSKLREIREKAEKAQRRIDKAKIPLTKWEQRDKDQKNAESRERRIKMASLSPEKKAAVERLKNSIDRLSGHHPQDDAGSGETVSEKRYHLRAQINKILDAVDYDKILDVINSGIYDVKSLDTEDLEIFKKVKNIK